MVLQSSDAMRCDAVGRERIDKSIHAMQVLCVLISTTYHLPATTTATITATTTLVLLYSVCLPVRQGIGEDGASGDVEGIMYKM